jgi:phosphatidylglycerol:prolipoprotein diacylglycerol transferase
VYPFGRFMLEFMRLDPSIIGGVNANQITMAVIASGAILALIIRHRKKSLVEVKKEDVITSEKPGE